VPKFTYPKRFILKSYRLAYKVVQAQNLVAIEVTVLVILNNHNDIEYGRLHSKISESVTTEDT